MLNLLSIRIKLLLGKANPFKIKAEHCALSEATRQTSAQFLAKKQISPSSFIYRFKLAEEMKVLGIQLGESVQIGRNSDIGTKIRPISRIDDPSIVDIAASTDIPSEEFFTTLKEKEQVVIQASENNPFVYEGFGKIKVQNKANQEKKVISTHKKIEYLGIIAEGHYVSSIFSLIEGISTNGDKTHVSLLLVNKSAEESLFIDELTWYAEEKRISLAVLIKDVPEGVHVLKGELREQHLADFMPPTNSECQILVAGSQTFTTQTQEVLKGLGYPEEKLSAV